MSNSWNETGLPIEFQRVGTNWFNIGLFLRNKRKNSQEVQSSNPSIDKLHPHLKQLNLRTGITNGQSVRLGYARVAIVFSMKGDTIASFYQWQLVCFLSVSNLQRMSLRILNYSKKITFLKTLPYICSAGSTLSPVKENQFVPNGWRCIASIQ